MPGSESKHSTDVANENESRVGRLICLRLTRLRLTQSNEWRALSSTVLASVTEFWLFLEFFGDFNVAVDGNAPNSVECFDSGPGIIDLAWQLTVWTLTKKTLKFENFIPNGENTKINSACSKYFHRIPMQSPILSKKSVFLCHEFIANSKMPVLPSRLK